MQNLHHGFGLESRFIDLDILLYIYVLKGFLEESLYKRYKKI